MMQCPACGSHQLQPGGEHMRCAACGYFQMFDAEILEHGRRVFEDVLRNTTFAPEVPIVIAGKMQGPDGPVICGYWRVYPDGTFERLSEETKDASP